MYSQKYREYFQELYTDTGLWSEDQIIDGYISESERRREEIILLLERRLSEDIVLGRTPANTLFLGWRSKVLFVSWIDEGAKRIITSLSIR